LAQECMLLGETLMHAKLLMLVVVVVVVRGW
jgi:hypothetical protein